MIWRRSPAIACSRTSSPARRRPAWWSGISNISLTRRLMPPPPLAGLVQQQPGHPGAGALWRPAQAGDGDRLAASATAHFGDCQGPGHAGRNHPGQLGNRAGLHRAGSGALDIQALWPGRVGEVCHWPVHRFPAAAYRFGLTLCHWGTIHRTPGGMGRPCGSPLPKEVAS